MGENHTVQPITYLLGGRGFKEVVAVFTMEDYTVPNHRKCSNMPAASVTISAISFYYQPTVGLVRKNSNSRPSTLQTHSLQQTHTVPRAAVRNTPLPGAQQGPRLPLPPVFPLTQLDFSGRWGTLSEQDKPGWPHLPLSSACLHPHAKPSVFCLT